MALWTRVTRRVLESIELMCGHVWLLSRGDWLVVDMTVKKVVIYVGSKMVRAELAYVQANFMPCWMSPGDVRLITAPLIVCCKVEDMCPRQILGSNTPFCNKNSLSSQNFNIICDCIYYFTRYKSSTMDLISLDSLMAPKIHSFPHNQT